jgi:uncharacterized protein (DUF305 family)
MNMRIGLAVALALVVSAGTTWASPEPEDMATTQSESGGEMDMMYGQDDDGGGFMKENHAAMAKMQHDMMSAPMNGNADHDFASMMIPHHQGAIDMARLELKYGKDPGLRKLAKTIIEAQKREISEMKERIKDLDTASTPTR